MNNEIREILEEMKTIIDTGKDINGIKVDGCGFHGRDLILLYDYIIDLQNENERLKNSIDWWKDRFFGQQEYDDSHRITAIEYKKRIEKAVEMLKEIYRILPGTYNQLLIEISQTLNILQNGSVYKE